MDFSADVVQVTQRLGTTQFKLQMCKIFCSLLLHGLQSNDFQYCQKIFAHDLQQKASGKDQDSWKHSDSQKNHLGT